MLKDKYHKEYTSISEIVQSANHLEHFHVYEKRQAEEATTKATSPSSIWDWHTDAGLFLVFLPAYDCNTHDSDESSSSNSASPASFWYQDQDGTPIEATLDKNTAIIMLGHGAQEWLNFDGQISLKATKHSVRWDKNTNGATTTTKSVVRDDVFGTGNCHH